MNHITRTVSEHIYSDQRAEVFENKVYRILKGKNKYSVEFKRKNELFKYNEIYRHSFQRRSEL